MLSRQSCQEVTLVSQGTLRRDEIADTTGQDVNSLSGTHDRRGALFLGNRIERTVDFVNTSCQSLGF